MAFFPSFSASTLLLAFRYLRSRVINLLGIGGIALAVWALIVVIAVFSGFISGLRDNFRSSSPEILIDRLPEPASFEEFDAIIQSDEAVAATAPRLDHYGIYWPTAMGNRVERQLTQALDFQSLAYRFVRMVGIDATLEREATPFSSWLMPGAMAADDLDRPFWVSADREGAGRRDARLPSRALPTPKDKNAFQPSYPGIVFGQYRILTEGAKLYVGMPMDLMSAHLPQMPTTVVEGSPVSPPEVRSINRRFIVSTAFKAKQRGLEETTAFIDIETMRSMLGHDIDDDNSVDLVNGIAVRAKPGTDLQVLATRLQAKLRETAPRARARTWEQQHRVFLGAVNQERGMMKMVLFAVMLVAGFLVYATLHMMVVQKTKDIGVLSALGASRGAVQWVFLLCALVVALIGCGLGAAMAVLTLRFLNPVNEWSFDTFGVELFPRRLYVLPEIPYRLETAWVLQVLAAAFILALIVAWFPARRAAKLDPVAALSYE